MRVALFGASGATGLLLTQRCLAAGHQVSALLRTPATFPYRERIRVVEGSVFDAKAIRSTLEDADAVLSTLGARSLKQEGVVERAVPLILAGMRETGSRRIICLGGASGVPQSLDRQPAPLAWFLRKVLYEGVLKWPSAAQRAQLAALSGSGMDWTLLMPPILTNGQARGSWRVDGDALPARGMRIARGDDADFIAQQISSRDWIGKLVYIAW
jgi:putative NADH-flavin reductase